MTCQPRFCLHPHPQQSKLCAEKCSLRGRPNNTTSSLRACTPTSSWTGPRHAACMLQHQGINCCVLFSRHLNSVVRTAHTAQKPGRNLCGKKGGSLHLSLLKPWSPKHCSLHCSFVFIVQPRNSMYSTAKFNARFTQKFLRANKVLMWRQSNQLFLLSNAVALPLTAIRV